MKIDKIVGILSVLLQREKVTVHELAELYEVSDRTVYRYIDTLGMAGIPIYSKRGNGGGIFIMEGYKIDKTLLSSKEMHAVLDGLRSLDSVSNTNYYSRLMEKFSAGSSMSAENKNIIIDLSGWDKSAVADKIEIIKNAIENKEKISFEYHSPNGGSSRIIEPYDLIYQWSSWYVRGFCKDKQDYRMFKLTRMTDLKNIGEKFEEREIPAYVPDKLRHTKGEITAVVRFDDSVKWRIIDEFGIDFINYNKNGEIEVTFTWSDVPSFFRYILTFGDNAEIISPQEYREQFAGLLKNISKKYEI